MSSPDQVSLSILAKYNKQTNYTHLAIAIFRHLSKVFEVCELTDKGSFASLESCLLQISPKSAVYVNVTGDEALPKQVRGKILTVVRSTLENEKVRRDDNEGQEEADTAGLGVNNSNLDEQTEQQQQQYQQSDSQMWLDVLQETTSGFDRQHAESVLKKKLLTEDSARSAGLDLFTQELPMRACGGLITALRLDGGGCGSGPTVNAMNQNQIQSQQMNNKTLVELYYNKCTIIPYAGLKSFMRLDKAAFSALHILPTSSGGGISEASQSMRAPTSILGFLNKCRSAIGTRKLKTWLRQPLVDIQKINERHDLVEAFTRDQGLLQKVQRTLKNVVDLDKIIAKFMRTQAGATTATELDDLYLVWRCLQCSVELVQILTENSNSNSSNNNTSPLTTLIILPLTKIIRQFAGFIQLVEQTVDMVEATKPSHRCVVNPKFDESFQRLAEKRDNCRRMMAEECVNCDKEVMAKSGAAPGKAKAKAKSKASTSSDINGNPLTQTDAVRLMEHLNGNMCFRVVKKNHQAVLSLMNTSAGKKYEQVMLRKAEFIFTSEKLKSLNEELKSSIKDYETMQRDLVQKCAKIASTYAPVVEKLSDLLGTIDVICSFAICSSCSASTFVRPKINGNGLNNDSTNTDGNSTVTSTSERTLSLIKSTHPLVEENLLSQQFIPNDCIMSTSNSRFLTITGPNMGGKSTYIRQVAICVLLNQIGMFIPAEKADLPIFSSIMARVGASDAQLLGVSTFMSEMIESATILQSSDENSLVIVDELGRGTSTEDGYGLAYSIAKFLCMEKKCFTLFATHFHELAELKEELGDVVGNKHAQCQVQEMEVVNTLNNNNTVTKAPKLTFLYEMVSGVASQSYGVHVARVANFPPEAIESAQRTADFLESSAHAKMGMGAMEGKENNNGEPAAKRRKILQPQMSNSGIDHASRQMQIFNAFGVSDAKALAKKLVSDDMTEEKFLETIKGCC